MSKLKIEYLLLPFIHLAIAVPLACFMNIWSDEASTLFTTQHGVFEAIQNTVRFEKQAPFYFILMSLWREIDSSIVFARLFSVICSAFSIAVFINLVKRLWDRNTAILAGFLFAIHPYLIWASTEIRVYALIILIVLLLLSLFERVYLSDGTDTRIAGFEFFAVAVIGLYTNFYIGFLLAALLAGLLVIQRFRQAKAYFLHMAVAGILFLPLLWLTGTHIGTGFDGFELPKSAVEGLRMIWEHFLSFALPTELFPPETQTSISYYRVWTVRVLAVAVAALYLLKRKLPDSNLFFWAAVTGVSAGFYLAAYFALNHLYIELRHAAVLFPPTLFLLITVIRDLEPKGKARFAYLAFFTVLFTASFSYAITAIYPSVPLKRGDWARVARYVEANEKQGQPIVVFRNYEALAFQQNYKGKNRVLPNDKYFYWNYEGEFGTSEMFPQQIEYTISVIPEDSQEIWLLTEELCQIGPACASLENFVKENYTVADTKDFYKERVRLLRKK